MALGDRAGGPLVDIEEPIPEEDFRTTWHPVDLGPHLAGEIVEENPTVLQRSDEARLLYPGRVNAIMGETESAKTWLALEAARQELCAGGSVLYLDFEDTAPRILGRLLTLGADRDAIAERFFYVAPDERLTERGWTDLGGLPSRVSLAVVDGVTEAMVREGLELRDNTDIQRFYDKLPRPLARAGPAVVTLDHVTKDREGRGRYAIGGQHKLAGIDGAAYVLQTIAAFGRGRDGKISLKVAKDRPGNVRGLDDGGRGEIHITSNGELLAIEIHPAAGHGADGFRPTVLMERVSNHLEAVSPDRLSKREVRDRVTGKATYIDRALDVLVEEGYVEHRDRGGYTHLRLFSDDDASEAS